MARYTELLQARVADETYKQIIRHAKIMKVDKSDVIRNILSVGLAYFTVGKKEPKSRLKRTN